MITRQEFNLGLVFDSKVLENRQRVAGYIRIPTHADIYRWRDFFGKRLQAVQLQAHEFLAQVQFALLPCLILADRLYVELAKTSPRKNPYRDPLLGSLHAVVVSLQGLEAALVHSIVEPDKSEFRDGVREWLFVLKEFDRFCAAHPGIFDGLEKDLEAFLDRLKAMRRYYLMERAKILDRHFPPYGANGHADSVKNLISCLEVHADRDLEKYCSEIEQTTGHRIQPTPEALHDYLNEWTQRWEKEYRAKRVSQ